jgi:hypothetical protein
MSSTTALAMRVSAFKSIMCSNGVEPEAWPADVIALSARIRSTGSPNCCPGAGRHRLTQSGMSRVTSNRKCGSNRLSLTQKQPFGSGPALEEAFGGLQRLKPIG